MAPKITCNAVKLASCISYFQRSRTAHSIKDLEKALPSVASINGMQVKDYLQALQDENKINVEKIGSGNWYWSFTSQDKKLKEKALADATSAHEEASVVNGKLRQKIADAAAQRNEEEDMLDQGGESREDLMAAKAEAEAEIKVLLKDLAAYSDNDPTELERKKNETKKFAADAEVYTDDIESIEGWIKKQGNEESLAVLRMGIYGDEYDTEQYALRELI